MDDQATYSFVYPGVVKDLKIQAQDQCPSSHIITTMHGIGQPVEDLTITGLSITPLTKDRAIPINAFTHKIPTIAELVPSPQEVSRIPGLSHLAHKFPTRKMWPTILLLGRDCMQVQTQDQLTWSTDKCQLAAKTPLGWVIMGQPAKSTRPLSKPKQMDSVA